MDPLLQVSKISKTFGGLRAVNQVSFTAEPQRITSLIGPNGAGKTTVFNTISGFLPPESGEIHFRGEAIHKLKPYEIARCGIGRTFQDPRIFPEMTVLNNVIVGLRQRGESIGPALWRGRLMSAERKAAHERSERILDAVGLLGRAREDACDLSFGEQRFLSIARALVSDPYLIMMDEPTVGLDKASIVKLLDLMRQLAAEPNRALLVIEHNMDVVMSVSDKIVLLVQGGVVATGTPEEIKTDRSMVEAYLGRPHVVAG